MTTNTKTPAIERETAVELKDADLDKVAGGVTESLPIYDGVRGPRPNLGVLKQGDGSVKPS